MAPFRAPISEHCLGNGNLTMLLKLVHFGDAHHFIQGGSSEINSLFNHLLLV